jgi:hypothetical protein
MLGKTGALCSVLCLLFASASLEAQQVTAAITGKVTDPQGAAVAKANVVAVDKDRGTEWPTTSNGDGEYSLPRLPIGHYDVKVSAPGFQTAVQSNILLDMNQTARLDFAMQVGSITQTVEVVSAAPLLQTQSTELGQVIDAATNVDLPLATRNYVQLTLLAPGSIHPNPSGFKSGLTTSSSSRPNVNGNREQSNNFILDGLDNNQVSDNLVGYAPAVDAIQEFNEITLTAPAEFGNYMGGIVSVTTKSGTNSYHGSAYEFFRNDKLNANSWTNNFEGVTRPITRWNNFGGTFGGAIKKDKLFIFGDYQGSRLDTPPSAAVTTVYTALERTGNFSELLSGSKPVQIYNPYALNANGTRQPFSGNIIPASLISAAAGKILSSSYYPTPTSSGVLNNLLYSTKSYINGDQGDVKVDWNISEKDRFYARYSQSYYTNPTIKSDELLYNSFNIYPTHTGVLDWTRSVSPSLVNEARFGVNYVYINNGSSSNGLSNFAQTVGIQDVPSSFLPAISLSGGNVSGFGTSDVYQLFADAVIHYEDTVIFTKGNHTMHFGFQGYRYRVDTFYSGNNGRAGQFNFNGQYTSYEPGASGGTKSGGVATGIAEADFLLGLPNEILGGVNGGTWGQRSNSLASFFQDDWRVTPNFTVNLGLRWELHTPWVEVDNRQANFGLFSGQEEIAGQNGASRALYNQYNGLTNFQPRIGLAWTPFGGKTVIRAGYTLSNYLEGTGTNLRLTINPPFAIEHDDPYNSGSAFVLPGSTLDQGFTPFASSAGDQYHNVTLRVWDPNDRPAVANQWNMTIQHQFTPSSTLTVAYVGQRSTHLMVAMPYLQKVLNANGTISPTQYLAGNPTLLADIGQISGTSSTGTQDYDALQATANKRLSGGLQFQGSYTYSKCMTNSIGYYGQSGQAATTSAYWQNIYNMVAEWGPCDYDATHNFVSNAIYSLPVGRGQKFGKNMPKALDAVIGGWKASGILSLHTGFPLTITSSDVSGTNARSARANCLAPGDVLGTDNSASGGYQYFSASSYSAETKGTFGTCGVGTIRGFGLKTLDFDVAKTFSVMEKYQLDLRGEFINLTNTPIFNAPTRSIGTTLGLLQSTQGARQVQLALKFHF